MTTNVKMVFLLALSLGVLGNLAVAQHRQQLETIRFRRCNMRYSILMKTNAALQTIAGRDRDRCDGDHDRDDRGCQWREHRYPSATAGNNGY